MKKIFSAGMLFLAAAALAQAYPWAVTVHYAEMSISIVDLGTSPPTVYGPFFKGQLGSDDDPDCDVAVTPDGRYAVVSNFKGMGVYKIDLADPAHPVLAGSIDLAPYWPNEVALSPDGRFAVLPEETGSRLIFVDIATFQNYSVYTLQTADPNGGVGSAAVAPDGTVIAAPWTENVLIYGKVNASGTGLVSEKRAALAGPALNFSISPDGATVLVACAWRIGIEVLKKAVSGDLVSVETILVPGGPQTAAFSPDGRKAYVFGMGEWHGVDKFSSLSITGPGQAVLEKSVNLLSQVSGGHFGIDVVDISSDYKYAVVGYPNWAFYGNVESLQLVSLNDFSVSYLPTGAKLPSAVACFDTAIFPPRDAAVTRVSSSLIFYKEAINRLTWQSDPAKYSPIVGFRVYRKNKTAADSAYQLVVDLPATVFKFDDRGLNNNTDYSYRITAVNAEGRESAPAEVSN